MLRGSVSVVLIVIGWTGHEGVEDGKIRSES